MDTNAVAVLVVAASAGSLSAAARRLGITPMVATRRLAALERDLGIRLMNRTTRSLSLTPEGEAFLPYAETLVEGEAAGRAVLTTAKTGVAGLLRVSASVSFGRKVLAPFIPRLLRANPGLTIDLESSDHVTDLVSSGIDVAVRIASHLRDNTLIAHRLSDSPRILCASPSYLEERGTPSTLEDLHEHDCLTQTGVTHWPFRVDGRERLVRITGSFSASNVDSLIEACINGGGIAMAAEWNAREELRQRKLVAIPLKDADPGQLFIWAVYPSKRLMLPKLRVFISALETHLRPIG